MIRYLQRSLKYFLMLCITYLVVLYAMSLLTNMILTPGERFHAIMSTPRGCFMLIAVVVLSAVYPYFGYMRRFVDGDLERNREQIMRVLESQHMKLDHITPGRLTFRADNIFRRLSLLFEDHIKVVQEDDGRLAISGNRKIVAYVVYLLSSAIKTANRECEESE